MPNKSLLTLGTLMVLLITGQSAVLASSGTSAASTTSAAAPSAGQSASATAASPLPAFTLPGIVVTANRYNKQDLNTPAATDVYDQARLQATGATNMYEALQYGVGLEIQQYGTGGSSMGNMTSKIVMRGNNNGTLVLINGIPVNIRGTYDLNDIPIENVERVEVVRGGGSVLYGSEATGGVINIITKKQKENFVKAAIGNYGQQQYSGSFQAGKMGLAYKYSKWGTINDMASEGKNWKGPENNNFDLTYAFTDKLTLEASHNESIYDYIATTGKTAMGKLVPANDARQHIKRNNIQLTYDDKSFKATAYYLDRDRDKDAARLAEGDFYSSDVEKSYNYGLDLQKVWNAKTAKWLLGATYQKENYSSDSASQAFKANGKLSGKRTYESTGGLQRRDNYSVYAQYDQRLGRKDNLILAARETWTGNAPASNNYNNFSGQAQYLHQLDKNQSIYASVGQSFKMPALYQIYKASVDLKPQTGLHYELGWKKNIDQNKSLRLALFHYKVDDNISATYIDATNTFTYANENLRNTGIEAEYNVNRVKGFGYNLGVSYSHPQTQQIDASGHNFDWQDDYSKLQLKAGLTYRMDKWKAGLNASWMSGRSTYKAVSASRRTPASLTKVDAKPYLLTNFNVEYQADKHSSIFAEFNNLLNRKDVSFFSTSSEYYVTPFSFLLGYQYKF
jgi:vitamin B12 transporter